MADLQTGGSESVPKRRLGLAIVGLLAGLLVGLLGAFVQAMRYIWDSPWGYVVIPWGALLALLVLVLTVRGAAWLAMTIVLSSESPGGSVALSGGGRQLFYLIGGVVIATATATIPVPLRRRAVNPEPAQ